MNWLSSRGFGVAVVVAAYLLGSATAARRPDVTFAWPHLFQDSGSNYLIADALRHGQVLYRDVAYPYGPLPISIYTSFSLVFGNNQYTYLLYFRLFDVLFGILLYLALRRVVPQAPALVVVLFGVWPFGGAAYHPIERCLFAALMLLWEPPATRTLSRALAVGAVLGVWQWVKFGGAVFAGAGLVTTDLIVLLAGGPVAGRFPTWFRSLAAAGAAFLVLEAARWAWAFAVLPGPVAWDFAWPAYTARLYADLPARYPQWSGWEEFLMRYCLATAALVAGGIALVGFAVSPQRRDPAWQRRALVFVPFFFCVFGPAGYFGHMFNYFMYFWCLAPPAALLLFRRPIALTAAILLAWLPQNLYLAREAWMAPVPAHVRPVTMPNGDCYWVENWYADAHDAILAEWDRARREHPSPRGSLLIVPSGAGFHYYYGIPTVSRHTSWYLPHYVRPYDEPALLAGLDDTILIAVTGIGAIDESADLDAIVRSVFSEAVRAKIRARVAEEVRVNSVCRIYRLKPAR